VSFARLIHGLRQVDKFDVIATRTIVCTWIRWRQDCRRRSWPSRPPTHSVRFLCSTGDRLLPPTPAAFTIVTVSPYSSFRYIQVLLFELDDFSFDTRFSTPSNTTTTTLLLYFLSTWSIESTLTIRQSTQCLIFFSFHSRAFRTAIQLDQLLNYRYLTLVLSTHDSVAFFSFPSATYFLTTTMPH
jgi:hypothetical protein